MKYEFKAEVKMRDGEIVPLTVKIEAEKGQHSAAEAQAVMAILAESDEIVDWRFV